MTKKTHFAIGKIVHRFRDDIPSFEVTTFLSYYDFGTEYYAGSKVGGESYTVMANTWRFVRYSETDDDGMNKESEIIDELIEDERHDCDAPEVTEWKPGEKPPCGVWLELLDPVNGRVTGYPVLKYKYISDRLALFVEKDTSDFEQAGEWRHFAHKLYIDPKEKAVAEIAFALAVKVIGFDAAIEINFRVDNDYSRDYRDMAKSIINGDIPLTKYTGDK